MGVLLDKAKTATESNPFFKGIIYGPPGTGKTYLVGDAPNPIWFDFENSTDTLATSSNPKHRQVSVLQVNPQGDIRTVEELCKAVKELATSSYETVVFDTLTALQRFQMNEWLLAQEGSGAQPLNYTKSMATGSGRNHYTAQIQDWGFSTNLLAEMFMVLQGLKRNVVLIAHDMTDKDELTKEIHTTVALTPSLGGLAVGLASFVGYLQATKRPPNGVARKMLINPFGRQVAKNRLNLQTHEIEDPTWDKLISIINNSRNGNK